MPAQIVSKPNPPPDHSHLPKELDALSIKLDINVLTDKEVEDIKNFRSAANYIAAGTYFLHLHSFLYLKIDPSYDLLKR